MVAPIALRALASHSLTIPAFFRFLNNLVFFPSDGLSAKERVFVSTHSWLVPCWMNIKSSHYQKNSWSLQLNNVGRTFVDL